MSEHSPEPWGYYPREKGEHVLYLPNTGKRLGPPDHLPNVTADTIIARLLGCSDSDAARVVACVNACAGISTEQLEKHGAAAILPRMMQALVKDPSTLNAAISKSEDIVLKQLIGKGYKITPPSRSDMSDKISRSLGGDK